MCLFPNAFQLLCTQQKSWIPLWAHWWKDVMFIINVSNIDAFIVSLHNDLSRVYVSLLQAIFEPISLFCFSFLQVIIIPSFPYWLHGWLPYALSPRQKGAWPRALIRCAHHIVGGATRRKRRLEERENLLSYPPLYSHLFLLWSPEWFF